MKLSKEELEQERRNIELWIEEQGKWLDEEIERQNNDKKNKKDGI